MRRILCALASSLLVTGLLALVAPGSAAAAQKTITYSVAPLGFVASDLGRFAAVADQTLRDRRGWSLGGTIEFRQVPSGGDFTLFLASASQVGVVPGCSAQYSCRAGRNVYINDDRWRFATPAWPYGLEAYRNYVIIHEVGHFLGLFHAGCPGGGQSAPVMAQQSIDTGGCLFNVWPRVEERDAVAGIQRVGVDPTRIEGRYRQTGAARGILGAPTGWETPAGIAGGVYQRFQGGEINWTFPTDAHEVYGAIVNRYRSIGGLYGPLGFPTTGELSTPGGRGRFNNFAGSGGGGLYWTPQTGANEVYGAIHDVWSDMGWEQGVMGFPTTGELATPDRRGRFNSFDGAGGGGIYWTPQTGAHAVYGAIYDRWSELRWETGRLGYPTSGEFSIDGGRRTNFERGYIQFQPGRGAFEVITR